jgi:sterol 3beta-glucosyltransferase
LTRCNPRNYIALRSIESVRPFRTTVCRLNGLIIRLKDGRQGIKLAFNCSGLRDEVICRINDRLSLFQQAAAVTAAHESSYSSLRRGHNMTSIIAPLSRSLATAIRANLPMDVKLRLPKTINIPPEVIGARSPLHFVCLTIGSRGDVQPYIALGLGLMQHNHRVTIVTHEEYKDWIEDFGIAHRTAGGDPGELMKLSVENKVRIPVHSS